jgi:hypothetical protein
VNPNNWLVRVLHETLSHIDREDVGRIAERILEALPLKALTETVHGSIVANLPPGVLGFGAVEGVDRIAPAASNIVQAIALALEEAA